MDLLDALRARSGVVCAVGAGGKKTTLYALAERGARGAAPRTVVTSTVRIPPFDPHVERVAVTDDPISAVEANERWPLGVVPAREGDDRYAGYDTGVVDSLAAAGIADLVLVKADGARMRQFKAPNEREPQLPRRADTVIPIASARAVGHPLSEDRVHRPERVSAITGRELGEEIRATDVARVLASPRGGLKDVPDGATVVPLINMVDDDRLQGIAEEIAAAILEAADAVSRVVLARMIDDDPVVAVVE